MSVRVVFDYDKQKWENFIIEHEYGNVFQSPKMYEVYCVTENNSPFCIFAIDDTDRLLGVLQAVIVKNSSGFLGKLTSRSIIIGGPLAINNDKKIIKTMLLAYVDKIKNKAIYSQIRNQWDVLPVNDAFQVAGFMFASHLNFIFNLNKGSDFVWKNISKSRRKKINKAVKNKLEFIVYESDISDEKLEEGFEIIREVYLYAKLPLSDISLVKSANKQKTIKMFTVYFDGKMIGCRYALCYNKIVFGWYAGSSRKFYNLFPNDFLIWKTLEWSTKNDYDIFDYGGAGKPNEKYGVRDFKSKIGGELVNFGRYEMIHNKLLMIIGKIGLLVWKKIKK